MQASRSETDQTARISLQISINVKKQRKQIPDPTPISRRPARSSIPKISSGPSALPAPLPGPSSVPAFGEAVFTETAIHPQVQNDRKMTEGRKFSPSR
jgi:hypothetical protein